MKNCLEGSNAVALMVNMCRPAVVSAYPITPQTHIVEDLSKFKSDGSATFEFVRADSEFAAASIVLGSSASGVRSYTATSSQGLLLMTEVVFTIAGMRLPVVMTVANRAVSGPINIWNDQQDAMTVRDSGWIMLFAETNQEAADLHISAFKIAELTRIPVMVNMDGFVLTHTYEPVEMPSAEMVKKYLPEYKPAAGQFLDTSDPKSLGTFATPEDYIDIRKDLFDDLASSKTVIKKEFISFKKYFGRGGGLVEYYGDKNAKTVFVSMGSVIGTIKDTVDELNEQGEKAAVVKVKCFRPFPVDEIVKVLNKAKNIAVIDKSVSLGQQGILALELKAAMQGASKVNITSVVAGLGGRDITRKDLHKVYIQVQKIGKKVLFLN